MTLLKIVAAVSISACCVVVAVIASVRIGDLQAGESCIENHENIELIVDG